MDRTFAKNAAIAGSEEYALLQNARKDYPNFEVAQRSIKRNPDKKTYNGLTYKYMRDYIVLHEQKEQRKAVLAEMDELILISKCHSKSFRYPVIKKWFLDKYPEIKLFGIEAEEVEAVEEAEEAVESEEPAAEKAAA